MKTIFSLIFALLLCISMAYALAVDAGVPGANQMLTGSGGSPSKVLIWRTASYLVRVDDSGDSKYIFALWEKGRNQQLIPDQLITGGAFVPVSTGGNHYYQFTSDKLTYRCFVIWLGTEESPPGYLIILNDEKEILREPVLEEIYSAI